MNVLTHPAIGYCYQMRVIIHSVEGARVHCITQTRRTEDLTADRNGIELEVQVNDLLPSVYDPRTLW